MATLFAAMCILSFPISMCLLLLASPSRIYPPTNMPLMFLNVIQDVLRESIPKNKASGQAVLNVELYESRSIYGYSNKDSLFLKVFVRLASFISTAKRCLLQGFQVNGLGLVTSSVTFESNLPYTLRFMIDKEMPGASWITVPEGKYNLRSEKDRISTCQIEMDVHHNDLVAHQAEGDWAHIAPLRILSFDIECAGRKGVFPEANVDPVIQIASVVNVQGQPEPIVQNVFTLNTCAHISGVDVSSFETEQELLEQWQEFFAAVDPDIVIGYNINGFDLPYLLDRADVLKVLKFPYLGRIKSILC
jgi:DNA polymerase delta subunit 1